MTPTVELMAMQPNEPAREARVEARATSTKKRPRQQKSKRRPRGSGGVFEMKGVNYFYVSYLKNGKKEREKTKFRCRFCENCKNRKPCADHLADYEQNRKLAEELVSQKIAQLEGRLKGRVLGEDEEITYERLRNYFLLHAEENGRSDIARVEKFEGRASAHIMTEAIYDQQKGGYLRKGATGLDARTLREQIHHSEQAPRHQLDSRGCARRGKASRYRLARRDNEPVARRPSEYVRGLLD
jgi:hypothetical protein